MTSRPPPPTPRELADALRSLTEGYAGKRRIFHALRVILGPVNLPARFLLANPGLIILARAGYEISLSASPSLPPLLSLLLCYSLLISSSTLGFFSSLQTHVSFSPSFTSLASVIAPSSCRRVTPHRIIPPQKRPIHNPLLSLSLSLSDCQAYSSMLCSSFLPLLYFLLLVLFQTR